jgi:hypothetical protein
MGPMTRIKAKFEIRWFQLACPATWVKRVTQLLTLEGEKPPFPLIINHWDVRERKKVWDRIRTAALIKAKVSTVGALYFIFI